MSPSDVCRALPQGNGVRSPLRPDSTAHSWGPDNTIVFTTADRSTGLLSVPAGGGQPKALTQPDPAQNERDHMFPSVLPNGRAVLFTIISGSIENAQVAVLDL